MMSNHNQNLIPPTPEGIAYGASLIKKGELVAFPTETVYGLGANALDAQACTSIFRAKGRPMTDPLIVHVAEPSLAAPLVSIEGSTREMFQQLAAEFWPGPLTIIVKAAACVPPEVTANTGFVGIRCPNHPLALTFLAACQLPVAAPSANLFGHVSPTLAQHVLDDLGAKGVQVLDGDSLHSAHTCLHGIESTVVKLDDSAGGNLHQITILRQGAVSQGQLEQLAAGSQGSGGAWAVLALQRQVHMDAPHSCEDSIADTDTSTASATVTGEEVTQRDPGPRVEDMAQSGGEVAPGQVSCMHDNMLLCSLYLLTAQHIFVCFFNIVSVFSLFRRV
jgi:tRNA threonylcarbamoyl adenosine modification protein (Sua5/YciO/YrdC/YwlC family)